MLTYKMNFKALIESVNPETKQMVVEYFDPHDNASLRLAISFNYDSTPEHLNQLIIDNTPHKFFHDRNEEKKAIAENNIDYSSLHALVGTTIEFNLPTYDNEVI